ncbi:MAG TPA: DUF6600 domain-containing protein [Candidatus Acidoferrum sp.]|nr:DUF6600 domain-containing protein [Candidatus Acidoferrum sp.]
MRKQVVKWMSVVSVALAALLFAAQRAAADDDDPPSRVARLAYASGNVSFNPAGTDDWVAAVVNRPMTTGDKLWSDDGSRAELHLDSAVIRLSDHTGFSFLNLSDETTQLRLTEGTLYLRVRRLGNDETFEVDTPNLAFSILRPGRYRINVNEAGDATIVTVRDGQAEVTGGGSAYAVHAREEGVFNGTDQLDADIERIRENDDDFDQWCSERDLRDDHSVSTRYVSDDVVGYEDLDEYGGWRTVPEYGNVWFPHTVVVGWAPYRFGHWVWISPWGWTWVDDEPWGFAPFHYGRWVAVGGVWGWVPVPPRPAVVTVAYVRPVYAPALVAWVGGAHWGVGVAVGGAPAAGVAWFPLGPRDVYCPSYHVSQTYVTNVNVSNTTIINRTQVTNVYNNVYVNKTVNVTNVTYQNQTAPNAVTAVSHQAFVSAQPVHNNMIRAGQKEFASAPVAPIAPAVAPEQRSVLGAGAPARVRPPAPILSRPVVAKMAPPPPPVSFVKQQEMVRDNGGRPPAISEMRRAEPENAQAARPNIKMAPAVRQGPPQNAPTSRADVQQGNSNRPGPAQNAPMPRPDNANRPAPPNVTSQPNQGSRPGNAPANAGNPRAYSDRPPSSRPGNSGANDSNAQLEQKHQQELQDLRNRQDQERQKVEQQQVQQRQKLEQDNARRQQPQADQRQQQLEQKQQQQLQQLEQKHDQQQQRVEQRQQQEHHNPPKQDKPQKQDKSSKSDKPRR